MDHRVKDTGCHFLSRADSIPVRSKSVRLQRCLPDLAGFRRVSSRVAQGATRDFADQKETKMPEGATIGASTGGTIGRDWLAGIGAVTLVLDTR
jgi:hypothetical protein